MNGTRIYLLEMENTKSKSVAIIGAGITGIMAAYYVSKKGYNVTVFDSEHYSAMKTSFANGGQISVSNSETWNTWSNVKKGIRWMFKKDAPLLIRPSFEYSKIAWLIKFLYHTYKNSYVENTKKSIEYGLESRKLYEEIRKEEKIKYDYSPCGILHFYKNTKYFKAAQNAKELYASANAMNEWNVVDSTTIDILEPALENTRGVLGGVWTPNDYTGDIHKFCIEMQKILTKKYKVQFKFDTTIDNIDRLSDFDIVIVSNGVGSTKIASSIGDSISVYPVKGYSITINLDEESQKFAPHVSLLDDEAKIVTARLGNRFRVAGTAELDGEDYDIRKDRIKPLLDWVHTNFPQINTHDYTSWACLRPMTPDMMPIVKQSTKNPKVYYHTGHGHLGWTYAPATAKLLSELIA